jgi:hypothetical protein
MPVNSHHQDYDLFQLRWRRCRDAIAGEDAVKAGAELYLPPLGKPGDKNYLSINKAYRDRAMYYNASGRTLNGVLGAINRKKPSMNPEVPYLTARANEVLEQVLSVGRCGVLVDAPKEGGVPYAVVYNTEDILNWRYRKDGDNTICEMIVLREVNDEHNTSDLFTSVTVTRYRVLEIKDGVYTQTVYRQTDSKNKNPTFDVEETIVPTIFGTPLAIIPFQFFGAKNLLPDVDNPPLLDLINVNLSHYRSSADLEHGRHFTALPTAWVAGFDTTQELRIGSGVAWVTDNVSAQAGFLEFSGAGLNSIVEALREKEALMAVLGARLLDTAPRKGVESAEALAIRQSADTATAASIANIVSEGMTTVFNWLLAFTEPNPQEASFQLNTDLLDATMSAGDVLSLISAWQQGGISQETLLWNLKRGEVLPPNINEQDEVERIANDQARFQGAGGTQQ